LTGTLDLRVPWIDGHRAVGAAGAARDDPTDHAMPLAAWRADAPSCGVTSHDQSADRAGERMIGFWIACLGLALIGLPDGSLGVAWPSLRQTERRAQAALGLILIGGAAGTFCAGLVSGRLLQAQGLRLTLMAAALVAASGLLVIATAPLTLVVCVGAVLLGLGLGAIDSGVNAAAAFSFDARRINWIHGCYALGAMAGPVLMTAIIVGAGLSWRIGYLCLAAMLAFASLPFARRAARTIGDPRGDEEAGAWRAASHTLVQLQIVLFFIYTGVEVMLGQWSYSVLTTYRGVPAGIAGLCTASYWGSLAIGRFALGMAVSHLGADRLLRYATFAVLAGAIVFAVAPGFWGVLGLIVSGLALAPVFPTLMARAPERLGRSVALHAIGFKVSAATVGGAVVPAIAGVLADAAGLGSIGWCAVGGSVILLALHEALLFAAPTRVAVRNS
jgi:fucose permease